MNRIVSPKRKLPGVAVAMAFAGIAALPGAGWAQGRNQNCPEEDVFYNPGNAEDVIVAAGFKVEVFAKGLNFPTDVAFVGDKGNFKVYVLESGTGLPGKCNTNEGVYGGAFAANNPFTPNIVVFDSTGQPISGRIGKPTSHDPRVNKGFQPNGPAIGLSFENDTKGGPLFATDSNQGARGAPGLGNNTSRILRLSDIDLAKSSATFTTMISGLPTGDHPTEQVVVKNGWVYWSQGSATNSGVTGLDNGAGGNQHEIACQQITLSQNTWRSPSVGKVTSGYSNFGVARPGAVVPPFEAATSPGMCTGAILRAPIGTPSVMQNSIEPVAWGFRNPYGIRFSPSNHPLKGELLVSENGEDERGARPTNNSPDRLQIARQNADGTPQWHGWPDRFGFLDSTQSIFNPKGSPADDDPSLAGKPVLPVLAFFPQQPVAPLALEPADVAAVGLDFVPRSFEGGLVKRHAVLLSREGDFGFSQANGTPEAGHDVELVNFSSGNRPLELSQLRFAFNCKQGDQRWDPDGTPRCAGETEQAFVNRLRGINRPTTIRFGPDGAAYLVDYGAVRDPGNSDPGSRFVNPANAPLVQMPGTGTIWKISRVSTGRHDDGEDDKD